ncbi:hypothetical protein SUGI_0653670 [Cryptomeria japonica]|nr:hypothetical protein SUGI_0653670 [Cryptomeria japonica]
MGLLSCISAPCKPMQSPASTGPGLDLTRFHRESVVDTPHLSFLDSASAAIDFGGIFHHKPAAIFRPVEAEEIAGFLRAVYMSNKLDHQVDFTVSAKGAGHSIYGQAQARAPNGLVVDMRALRGIQIHNKYADVAAGELWADVLIESLKVGLAPRSWTDYLYLTVGGTLSNAGVSGQTFRHGPQISNVLQLDIVTGTGELLNCSASENEDLFYGAMGGLGQFGIITKARIILEPAPQRVRWVRIFYNDFEQFARDQELIVSMHNGVDYLEGFMILNSEAMHSWSVGFPTAKLPNESFVQGIGSQVHFCIEIAMYFTHHGTAHMDKVVGRVMSRLSFIPSSIFSADVSYFNFLNRVHAEELNLRSSGLWDVPHPWLNMFVPRSKIHQFTSNLTQIIPRHTFKGPILIYPVLRSKWNTNMSAVLPEDNEEIFYVVGMLRSADPHCSSGTSCMDNLLLQNQEIVDISTTMSELNVDNGIAATAKQYLPYYTSESQWKNHFGSKWEMFVQRKARYDPLNVLGPGQRIFKRKTRSTTHTQ